MRRLFPFLLFALAACAPATPSPSSPAPTDANVDVRIDLAQAEAAMAVVRRLAAREPVPDSLWTRLQATAGYRRLLERERAMRRELTDSMFRAFLESDTLLARARALDAAVARWRGVDVRAAARRAAAYLPNAQPLRATLYPVVKPKTNSFVWDLQRDPAFFMYVDPAVSAAETENTVAHELHHVGISAACRESRPAAPAPTDSVAAARRATALRWAGAFSEGLAMLAAAGGPAAHPHATSPDSVRRRWDRDVTNAPSDMARVSSFLSRILDGTLAGDDSIAAEGMEFFGTQGAWYTVGYVMARAVETAHGRPRLLAVACDGAAFLSAYDSAAVLLNARGDDQYASRAGKLPWPLPRWSPGLLVRLGATPAR